MPHRRRSRAWSSDERQCNGDGIICDTTDSHAVANPVRVEHLIVMLPKQRLVERGPALDTPMARRLGGSGGIALTRREALRERIKQHVGEHLGTACACAEAGMPGGV